MVLCEDCSPPTRDKRCHRAAMLAGGVNLRRFGCYPCHDATCRSTVPPVGSVVAAVISRFFSSPASVLLNSPAMSSPVRSMRRRRERLCSVRAMTWVPSGRVIEATPKGLPLAEPVGASGWVF